VATLLAAGADKEKVLQTGATPLYLASQNGHKDVVAMLLAAGADKERVLEIGATPLYAASQEGHNDVVAMLLAAGADVHQDDEESLTASCYAWGESISK
jgi:ankyrin repeat protein